MLSPGDRLGPYEIIGPLGAGGMGEVWRARDTRLGREVALKVLVGGHAENPAMRERFEREARAISALAHPSICTLYDIGEHEGSHFLVMEYLEGETLAARLARGPLPLDSALKLGGEIAAALAAAHARGIVHRDLKPGNVMLTRSGAKLLDFGLARLHAASHGETELGFRETVAEPLTGEGTILGTLQYMAPEQLEGREADARSDIFAFGCVLYEMATGRKAFTGTSRASLASAILSSEPAPLSTVRPASPPGLDRLVAACLAKDPATRWHSAADLARELSWIAGGSKDGATAGGSTRNRVPLAPLLGAVAIGAAVTAIVGLALRPQARSAPDAARFSILPPAGYRFGPAVAFSPDGRGLLFEAIDAGGKSSAWVRPLDALAATRVPGSDAARLPFWSPDGRWVAFFGDQHVRRVELASGALQTISGAGLGMGGSWNRAGTILYAPAFGQPLVGVPASGGTPAAATALDASRGDAAHLFPAFLPDGRHFVFVARNLDPEKTTICLGELGTTAVEPLFRADSAASYADPGYLLFAREGALLAQRLDPHRLVPVGEPSVVAENVLFYPAMNGLPASASPGGALVYSIWSHERRLVWVDRRGREIGSLGPVAHYEEVAISPDGGRVAVSERDPGRGQNLDVWVLDAKTGIASRVTAERTDEFRPVWTPDGGRLVYASDHAGFYDLYSRPAAGGPEEVVRRSAADKFPEQVSPDGRSITFSVQGGARAGVWIAPISGGTPQPVDPEPEFDQFAAKLSPDGRWVAFDSTESGRSEIYVKPFRAGPKRQVSTGGGAVPVWRRDGRELFYVSADGMLTAVALRAGASGIEVDAPVPLFELHSAPTQYLASHVYDAAADGSRFLVVRRAERAEPDRLVVDLDWQRALKR